MTTGECGWCEYSRTCLAGTASGPTTGTCNQGWAITESDCNCFAKSSCSTCTEMSECAWCSSFYPSCVPGSESGPKGTATCANDNWNTQPSQCGISCSSFDSCASCTEQVGCGWCPQNFDDDGWAGTCMKGTNSPSAGAVCNHMWAQYTSSCANIIFGMNVVVFALAVVTLPAVVLIAIVVAVAVGVRRARAKRLYATLNGRAAEPHTVTATAQPGYSAMPTSNQ
eukprot:CAMPEP_0113880684 /NCGR_PEP_ID=MMETSP0780_2-20120614/7928_1 /TAXON_ID=652834 /ORGANISM="Palpitomonas bilix" /LENGTH=224 /DNA_ID=CAMNT_0000867399 /DNA_START=280 /DNA_END=954 /DNA_ORIENTATION=- /assembly_acc=CAM_ASM_000599